MSAKNRFSLSVLYSLGVLVASATAQSPVTTRLSILQAEDRRAPTANDLAIIRAGAHSADPQTVRIALRALGRLERPSLIADIAPGLRHATPEVRIEAATAIGQAAQGWKRDRSATPAAIDAAAATVAARLKIEADADVRAALCETIGRLPYASAAQVEHAERTLVDVAARSDLVGDRLGVAKGLEALVRLQRATRPPSDDALSALRRYVAPKAAELATGARVRRLALETLITAGAVSDELISAAAHDPDAQVRRLAMRAAAAREKTPKSDAVLLAALGNPTSIALSTAASGDESPIVRLEALRSLNARGGDDVCPASAVRSSDRDPHVALQAIDQLAGCGASPAAVALLDALVTDRGAFTAPRAWHRAAHAIVALAAAAPDRAAAALPTLAGADTWQVRMYAARAAAALKNRALLERFAGDESDNVREAAIAGLKSVAGHDADAVYVAQLTRRGYQVLRAAASALDGSPHGDAAVAALKAAADRLKTEGRDNSHDARDAIATALASAGEANGGGRARGQPPAPAARAQPARNDLSADDLRRLASPRARITIRDVGTFELALFTAQAPATVLRFAHLAESGYYNGLSFHRVVPNFVIQGGSPGANEYVGDAAFMRDEVGSWPHVRGAVGISTRGRDTGDAQIFIDLVDNPRLDHEYTVFAQVLNGIDVVDRIVEGDVIERIEIVQ
jgi:cyclophilin family peptidyl-prolyl cis-trans isomerase